MTLWLTRLTPNLRHPDVIADFSDVRNLHRRVMHFFPDDLGETPRREAAALFRTETFQDSVRVLIQSALQPDLSQLPPGYGESGTLRLVNFLASLKDGMPVRYRIAANPSKQLPRGHTGPGRPGQRVALYSAEAEEWWHKRAAGAGLTLHSAVMSPSRPLTDRAHRAESRMKHAIAQFDGTAVVHDASALRAAIRDGVGRGKPYGCGLLSVLPVRSGDPER